MLIKAIHERWKAFPGRDSSQFSLNYRRWWVRISRIKSMDGIFTSFSAQIAQPARNLFSFEIIVALCENWNWTFRCFSVHFEAEISAAEIFAKNNWSRATNEKWEDEMSLTWFPYSRLSCPMQSRKPLAGRSRKTSNDINWNFFVLIKSHLRSVFFDLPSTHRTRWSGSIKKFDHPTIKLNQRRRLSGKKKKNQLK